MRRRTTSFVFLALVLTAALIPGAAVFSARAQSACQLSAIPLEESIRESKMVVVGTVVDDGNPVTLRPEAFLKGAASKGDLSLAEAPADGSCAVAPLAKGDRVLAIISDSDGHLVRPYAQQLFYLEAGRALDAIGRKDVGSEASLIDRVRAQTFQYAVPAASADEGAGIDWVGTVMPVGLALVAVFVIGLFLMRIWHRIDPS